MRKIKNLFLKITVLCVSAVLALSTISMQATFAESNNRISVYVNDDVMTFDVEPMIINSRTMVPMRAIFEALGASVTWEAGTQTAVGTREGVAVSLTIGSSTMYVGNDAKKIDAAPVIVSDRTLMPLRAISEAYGFEVNWDDATKSAYIGAHMRLDSINKMISEMTLDEKIYQMMIVTPESITKVDTAVVAGEKTREALVTYPVGGIIYFSKNIENSEQIKAMLQNTQSYSRIPLFMAIDEEGGQVARLGNAGIGFPAFPPMREIGDSGDVSKALEVGQNLGYNLKEYGFNLDFAPVADVAIVDKASIGNRSFGSDPVLVGNMVHSAVLGLQQNNVSACIKHFPGLGSSAKDTHNGFVSTNRTLDELKSCEFIPFESGADAGADFAMVGHISVPKVTGVDVPASLSSRMVSMLRNDVGFSGVVVTDALNMGAIIQNYTTTKACVAAVDAGVDVLLMPSDIDEAHFAIGTAVADGIISVECIDDSIARILDKKITRGLIEYK